MPFLPVVAIHWDREPGQQGGSRSAVKLQSIDVNRLKDAEAHPKKSRQ